MRNRDRNRSTPGRRAARTAGSASVHRSGGSNSRRGSPADGPSNMAAAARRRVVSSAQSGPGTSNDGASGTMPARDTRWWLGRSPYNPHQLAGIRTEPAVSVPSPMSARPAATAAAGPLDDPPGRCPGARGLSGVP